MLFRKHPGVCKAVLLLSALQAITASAAESGVSIADIPLAARSLDGRSVTAKPSCFTQGVQALEAGEHARALELFDHAADEADIRSHPLSWLKAGFQACQSLNLLGRQPEAISRAREIVDTCESILGGEDPLTSDALSHLAFLLRQNGRLAEAEPVYLKNLRQLANKHGEDSFFAAEARTRLANLLMSLNRLPEAEKLHRQALQAVETTLGEEHVDRCFFLSHLAFCLHSAGKSAEARQRMHDAHEMILTNGVRAMTYPGSTLRRQAEFFRDTRQLAKARVAGQLCMAWYASRSEGDRARFFYYDSVQQLYRSILTADGLQTPEIDAHLAQFTADGAARR